MVNQPAPALKSSPTSPPLSYSHRSHQEPSGTVRRWVRHLPRQGAYASRVDPPDAARRRVYAPLPPARAAQGMHHSPLLRPPKPKPSPSTGTDQALLAACPSHAQAAQSGRTRDRHETSLAPEAALHCPTCGGPLVFLFHTITQEKKTALMSERWDLHHVHASLGRERSTRRAQPCRHRLTRFLLPVHSQPGDVCLPHRRPLDNAPLPDSVDTALRPLAAPLCPVCTALLYSIAAPLAR